MLNRTAALARCSARGVYIRYRFRCFEDSAAILSSAAVGRAQDVIAISDRLEQDGIVLLLPDTHSVGAWQSPFRRLFAQNYSV